MVYKVNFVSSPKEVQSLYEFVQKFPLDYPNYFVWLEKCKIELEIGYKKAYYAINSDNKIVGSIIFQKHKQKNHVIEIKNLRVDPLYEKQGIGSLLESKVSLFAKENGFIKIECDAHPESSVVNFFLRKGYKIEAQVSLYTEEKEIIMSKDI
jgi:ribosomal protein S18 acetylase RimI-like enzyme